MISDMDMYGWNLPQPFLEIKSEIAKAFAGMVAKHLNRTLTSPYLDHDDTLLILPLVQVLA